MILGRVPPWFRDDPTLKTITREVEHVKAESYYNFMQAYPKQPLQTWVDFKEKEYTFERVVWNGGNDVSVDLSGAYPTMFNFSITVGEVELPQPVEIKSQNETLIIRRNLLPSKTYTITPQMKLLEDGVEIFNITDQSQEDSSALIKLGDKDSNWKLRQTFTMTKSNLSNLVIMFGQTVGNPEDDIVISLYSGEELLDTRTIPNTTILENLNHEFPIGFEIETSPLEEYTLEISRTDDINDEKYYTLKGSTTTYSNGVLTGYNNEAWSTVLVPEDIGTPEVPEWVNSEASLFFIAQVPPLVGDYPTLLPPLDTITLECENAPSEFYLEDNGVSFSGSAMGVEVDKIFIKAHSMFVHPIEYVRLYLERDDHADLIEEATFQFELEQKCFFTSIHAEDIYEPISKLPFKMFAEIKYWNIEEPIRKGFPQSYDDDDPIYRFNANLDNLARGYGLFRRKYKEDIPYYDYYKTYPKGYPWLDEQDYWFEKRINDEYATRPDKIEMVELEDVDGLELLEFRCKNPDIHNVKIEIFEEPDDCCICPDNIYTIVSFKDKDIQGVTRIYEEFIWDGDVIKLMDDINFGSELIEATYLNNTNSSLQLGVSYLYTEGTYQAYGLIKAEINQYLGVIPRIKDRVDYCLIWNKEDRAWNKDVWGGEEWDSGVFELQIPWERIPKNFKLLEISEIQQIIDRCKPFGTKALPMYYVDKLLRLEFNVEQGGTEYINYLDPIDFVAYPADMSGDVLTSFEVTVSQIEIINNELEVNFGFTIDTEVAVMLDSGDILLSDGQFVNTYVSSGIVKFYTTTQRNEPHPITFTQDGSGATWVDIERVGQIDGNSAHATASTIQNSKHIRGTCYPSVPSDAVITGVAVRARYANTSVTRSPYFTQKIHSVTLQNKDIYTTKSTTYPGGSATYDGWFGDNGDLWGQSSSPAIWNQGVNIHYWATLDTGKSVWLDAMYLILWYRRKGGTYYTTTLLAPTVTPPDEGSWDILEIEDTKPSGTNVLYDVFNHAPEQVQTQYSNNYAFGNTTYTEVAQTFIPTTSKISGVWVKAGNPAIVGTPTYQPKFTLRDDATGAILIEKTIPVESWTNDAEIFIPMNIDVTPEKKYRVTWWATGSDASNYFNMRYVNEQLYRPGEGCYLWVWENGVGWRTINAGNSSAWFKVTRANTLLADRTSGNIDISTLPFEDLTVKAKMSTNNPDVVPSVDAIKIKSKVVKG